jgi:hypothetical protein
MATMKNRRGFLLTCVTGLVAMSLVVGTVIADELLGALSKVDVEGKVITVIEKDTDKEVKIKITDDTILIAKKKGEVVESKVDLEKLANGLKKAEDAGKKVNLKVTHEKGVASKIEFQKKKKAAQ